MDDIKNDLFDYSVDKDVIFYPLYNYDDKTYEVNFYNS
jgi:hypothetical protein